MINDLRPENVAVALQACRRHQEATESVCRRARGIAHDVNNLLTVIQCHASLVGAGASPADVRESAVGIEDAAERAGVLIRQILVTAGHSSLPRTVIGVHETLRGMSRLMAAILGVQTTFELSLAEEPLHVEVEPGMLDQVVLNMVTNARDAMPSGGRVIVTTALRAPTLEPVRSRARVQAGRYVALGFADSGIGIPRDSLPHIFEASFTTKPSGRACGVGLATVAEVVARHGGWVDVQSTGATGTTFLVWLPAASPPLAEDPTD